jgi:hypothetical protein
MCRVQISLKYLKQTLADFIGHDHLSGKVVDAGIADVCMADSVQVGADVFEADVRQRLRRLLVDEEWTHQHFYSSEKQDFSN